MARTACSSWQVEARLEFAPMAFDEQGTFLCDNVLYACAQATQLQAPPQADTHVVSLMLRLPLSRDQLTAVQQDLATAIASVAQVAPPLLTLARLLACCTPLAGRCASRLASYYMTCQLAHTSIGHMRPGGRERGIVSHARRSAGAGGKGAVGGIGPGGCAAPRRSCPRRRSSGPGFRSERGEGADGGGSPQRYR